MNLSKITNYFYPYRILDIGANIGQFHTLAKQTFQDSYIFSIEASSIDSLYNGQDKGDGSITTPETLKSLEIKKIS